MARSTKSVRPGDDITRALDRILPLLIIYGILEALDFSNNVPNIPLNDALTSF
jgi:hypothetical protein